MKRLLFFICSACLVASCGAPHPSSSKIASTRVMKHNSTLSSEPDSIIVTGSEFIPVLGKNELGVSRNIEGTWVLQSMPGSTNDGKQTAPELKSKTDEGKPFTGNAIGNKMKNSSEVKRESSVLKNGDTVHTSTTVYLVNKEGESRITPPQSSNPNMHAPEAPRLSFYGSNETFSGFTGCNKISGRYTLKGNSLHFQNANPSFKMVCIGDYDEEAFLGAIRKVTAFTSANGQLQLMEGDKVLMVFSKK